MMSYKIKNEFHAGIDFNSSNSKKYINTENKNLGQTIKTEIYRVYLSTKTWDMFEECVRLYMSHVCTHTYPAYI